MHRSLTAPTSASPASAGCGYPVGFPGRARVREAGWPLERVLFVLAGTFTGASAMLAAVVSPWFLLVTGFIAVNQLAYAAFGVCGASFLLSELAGLRSALYAGDHKGNR